MDTEFWQHVRAHVAREAAHWSCGTEGRLLFENLVAHEDWQDRLQSLAPELSGLSAGDTATAIVTNYFSQNI